MHVQTEKPSGCLLLWHPMIFIAADTHIKVPGFRTKQSAHPCLKMKLAAIVCCCMCVDQNLTITNIFHLANLATYEHIMHTTTHMSALGIRTVAFCCLQHHFFAFSFGNSYRLFCYVFVLFSAHI